MTISLLSPDGVPLTAKQERQAKAAQHGGGPSRPLGGRSGFRVGTATDTLTVTSTSWTLKPCAAMIDPGAATDQGFYGWASDSNIGTANNLTPADQNNARKDIVYIQVNDSSAGDGTPGTPSAPVLYLAGSATATPTAPDLPPRSFLVGTIDVPKVSGGAPTATLNPARYVASGAPLPVFSLTDRDAQDKFDGFTVRRMDVSGRPLETWDGAEWRRFSSVFAEAEGVASIGIVPSGASVGPYWQAFPAGKFTVAPNVKVGTNQTRVSAAADNVTKDGFNLYMSNFTPGASTAGEMRWSAKQMTATSATG